MALPQDRPPPSAAAIAVASAIIAGLFGYFIGQFSTLGTVTNKGPVPVPADSSSDEDDEFSEKYALNAGSGSNEECKLVLVVRTDLGMTKGTTTRHSPHSRSQLTRTRLFRQNSGAMLSCNPSMLQILPSQRPRIRDTATLGEARPGEGSTAS